MAYISTCVFQCSNLTCQSDGIVLFYAFRLETCWATSLMFTSCVFKARNTLEHTRVCITLYHTKLPQRVSVDSTNKQKHALQTYLRGAQTRSNHCRSIKVSIILCVISVDTFFAISVASVMDGCISCYSE